MKSCATSRIKKLRLTKDYVRCNLSQVISRKLYNKLAAGMTTGFSPPPMPDDTLDMSAILDDSGEAEDGLTRWLGEKEAKGRTAMSAHRILLPMEDDIRP